MCSIPSDILQEYRLSTVSYGTSCAPCLATHCLKQLTDDFKNDFPVASNIVENNFCVTYLLAGSETIDEAISFRDDLVGILKGVEFELRKWASNHTALLP